MEDKKMPDILLGYEVGTGKPVHIPIMHTLVSGLTQTGKTTWIKQAAKLAADLGFTVLIMDVKTKTIGGHDFANMGADTPIFLSQSTDPLILKGLLESEAHFRLNFQFPELIRVSEHATLWSEISDNIDTLMNSKKLHPIRREKLETLRFLFDRLIDELGRTTISPTLKLSPGINVMDLTKQSSAFKQLVVKAVCEYVRNHLSNIIIIFDEAHLHIPQGYGSASKQAVTTLIKEGASSKQFVWIADQAITDIDKDPIKQCEVWLLGRQRELNEAERTFKQLPYKENIKPEDIMRLPTGFFLASTHEWAKKVYIHLNGVPEKDSIRVAKGELTPEYIRDHYLTKEEENGNDMSKLDDALRKVSDLERELTKFKSTKLEESWKEPVKNLTKEVEELQKQIKSLEQHEPKTKETPFTGINLEHKPLTLNIQEKGERIVTYATDTIVGQILFCAYNELPPEGWTFEELHNAMVEHGWGVKENTMRTKLSIFTSYGLLVKIDKGYRTPKFVKYKKKGEEK